MTMHDRNGAELKANDTVDVTFRTHVLRSDDPGFVLVARPSLLGGCESFPEGALTKVVPEFEWREKHNSLRNTIHTLNSNTRCQHVAWVQAELQCDEIRWKMKSIFDHEARIYDTLEAAKAAALAACRSAAEGGKEQS